MKIEFEIDRDQADALSKLLRRIGPRELEELLDDPQEAQAFTVASDRLRLAILGASLPKED